MGAGDIVRIETPLEGNDVAHLMFGTANAKQATLSFWVKSPKTGAHYVNFSESSSYARCYPALYTVSVADTWEYKTITLTGDTTGTWGTGLGVGLTAGFVLMAGSSFLGTADTWQAASVFAASGVVNCMDNIANNFFLTGVKLEVGSTATAFVPDDYSTAMAKCQRYFCKTYIYAHAPGTATSASAIFSNADSTSAAGPSYGLMGYFSYPVYMRTSPTLTTYGITTGSLWYNMTTGGSLAVGTLGNGNRACTLVCTAAPSTGVSYSIQATADAEL